MRILREALTCILLTLSLTGCMVINNVSEISPSDRISPSPERAVVFLGIGWDDPHAENRMNIYIAKFKEGKNHKFKNDCFFSRYDLIAAHATPSAERQYFAFSVTPGYYIYSGANYAGVVRYGPLEKKDEFVFKANAGEVVYLGDFIQTAKKVDTKNCYHCAEKYTIDFRQDYDAAKIAMKKFRSLRKDARPAQHAEIEGERVPIPFCTL